jgi:ABC-type nitrate/sulfonate/bicarbonate transport system substrate-binding protein
MSACASAPVGADTGRTTPTVQAPVGARESAQAVEGQPLARRVPLKTAYTTTAGTMAPLWAAKEAGIFDELGFDAELALITSGQAMLGALLSREVPLAMVGANQIVEANLQGGEYLIVGSAMPYLPNSVYVHASIRQPDDLRGKVLGTSNYGSITHVALRAAFEYWGLVEGRDVTVTRTGGVPEILAAMETGATVGGAFSPPQTFQARDMGYRELIDLAATRYEFASASVATTRRFVADDPDTVERYLKALIRGAHVFKTNRELAIQTIMRYGLIDDRAVAEESWAWYRDKLSDDLWMSPGALENHLRIAAEQRPDALSTPPDQLVDNHLVERIKASGYVDQVMRGS